MRNKFLVLLFIVALFVLCGCDENGTIADTKAQISIGNRLAENQPIPTDINYSLERYNLIRRTYWVNGMREKANTLPCPVVKPMGYILLFTESGQIVGNFIVDGKVTSLNAYLTPDSEYYDGCGSTSSTTCKNAWLADVDGAYGENDKGIFFFTPDGKYLEWTGIYLYSDIPFDVQNALLTVGE